MAGIISLSIEHPNGDGPIKGFRWFWAFTVTGFNPRRHCQASFKGTLAPLLNSSNARTGEFEFDIPDGGLLYVCGVSAGPKHLRRTNNMHLPLRFLPGGDGSIVTYNDYKLVWRSAALIPIPEVQPRASIPEPHFRCANFRIAEAWFGSGAR